jgi:hypothetical protein
LETVKARSILRRSHLGVRRLAPAFFSDSPRRERSDAEGQMSWPLTRAEVSALIAAGLRELSFEDLLDVEDPEEPPVRRFRVLYTAKSV